jgi:hypothetical protein
LFFVLFYFVVFFLLLLFLFVCLFFFVAFLVACYVDGLYFFSHYVIYSLLFSRFSVEGLYCIFLFLVSFLWFCLTR